MPRRTADLKAEIDQIAGNKAAEPDEERHVGAASPAAAVASPPATDAIMPNLHEVGEPVASPTPPPRRGTAPADGGDTTQAKPQRERKRHRGPHISVRLDEELHKDIKQMAADVERSVENMVRRILRRAIHEHKAAKANGAVGPVD